MSKMGVVRAWKDAEYRGSLSAEELALLPEHPAGSIELVDEELELIQGGNECLTGQSCSQGLICQTILRLADVYTPWFL